MTLLVGSRKIASEMTYNVSSGTLNTTVPYHTITTLGEVTDDKRMNRQHFGIGPALTCIRIWINLEIWIRILDHLCLRFDTLVEVFAP